MDKIYLSYENTIYTIKMEIDKWISIPNLMSNLKSVLDFGIPHKL